MSLFLSRLSRCWTRLLLWNWNGTQKPLLAENYSTIVRVVNLARRLQSSRESSQERNGQKTAVCSSSVEVVTASEPIGPLALCFRVLSLCSSLSRHSHRFEVTAAAATGPTLWEENGRGGNRERHTIKRIQSDPAIIPTSPLVCLMCLATLQRL